jgi:PleD family two-component response regulator
VEEWTRACDSCRDQKVVGIILDISLPVMRGVELCGLGEKENSNRTFELDLNAFVGVY